MNYTITQSERPTAKHKVTIDTYGKPIEMHLNKNLTINRPFVMECPVDAVEFSRIMQGIHAKLSGRERGSAATKLCPTCGFEATIIGNKIDCPHCGQYEEKLS